MEQDAVNKSVNAMESDDESVEFTIMSLGRGPLLFVHPPPPTGRHLLLGADTFMCRDVPENYSPGTSETSGLC